MLWMILQDPKEGVALFAMLILAISVHEMAHAWMAFRRGDDTAALMGRLTINPVAHFDPLGLLFIMFATIGWGKPVPFNPLKLKNIQKDSMLIALAGPVSNLLQALALAILYRLCTYPPIGEAILNTYFGGTLFESCILVTKYGVFINLALAFFNLIPLFPLDGEKVLGGLLPYQQAIKLEEFRQHSIMILFMIIAAGSLLNLDIIGVYLNNIITPLMYAMLGWLNPAFMLG